MKNTAICLLFLLSLSVNSMADIHAQGGIESYMGANHLSVITPWLAIRASLSKTSSLIFKYYNHNIQFRYDNGVETVKQDTQLTNLTSVFYFQNEKQDIYTALSYYMGKNSYRALAVDSGVKFNLNRFLALESSLYALVEKSTLWYPLDKPRYIFLYSFRGGVQVKLTKWMTLNPKVYFYRNSEEVNAISYSAGLVFTPKYPFIITAYYFRYKESAQYRFSGDYFSVGLNFYY